jgi:3'-5' exonuclease
MRRVVTIDIETLPAPEPIEMVGFTSGSKKEDHLKTALNGDFGRILCVGYIDEQPNGNVEYGVIGWDDENQRFSNDEQSILIEFWERLRTFRPGRDQIVGHNIFDFDLKFIYKRSIVNRVRPTVDLSFARYRSQPIFDTMCEWEKWSYGNRISLDRLAKVLGLPSSKADGVDGSKVHELFKLGQYRAIMDYCLRDVELTRNIFNRIVFADCVPPYRCNVEPEMVNV